MRTYDLVTIGNYTKDTIVSAAGTRHVDGGGYSYAAHAAHLKGISIAAVTRLAAEDRGSTDALRAKGIDVHIIESPHSTLMCLKYPTDNVDERTLTVAAVADPFTPELLRDFKARAFVVNGSARGEASLEVMQALKAKGGLLCADLQGFIRVVSDTGQLEYRPWPEQAEILGLVDILKTDAVEAEFITGKDDIHQAAAELATFGPEDIVLTHRDGLLVLSGGKYYEAAFHPDELRGRSGRGDTCMGSYVSSRLNATAEDSTIWAAAVTSLKLEREGPVNRSREDVEALIAAKYRNGAARAAAGSVA
ncbi:MAG TPA: PfkB family carbohydrate kinase [Woeseiaceae bacterium]|nr:PfkB family carbohydrate kinase [Woeseiaceae bacterium]